MTTHYVTFVINLDKRDSKGHPTLMKKPNEPIAFAIDDRVKFTVSIIEGGSAVSVFTQDMWTDYGHLDPNDYIRPLKVKQP